MNVRADRPGPKSAWSSASLRIVLAGGLTALCLLGFAVSQISRHQADASRRSQQSLMVLARAAMLRADLAMASSEARGYLFDTDPDRMLRFNKSAEQVQADIDRLRVLVAEDAKQRAALEQVAETVTGRIAYLREAVALARAGDHEALARRVQLQQARVQMDRFVAGVEAIEGEARARFVSREKEVKQANQWLVAGLLGCGILATMSALLGISLMLTRDRERSHLAALRQSEERLRLLIEDAPDYGNIMLDEAGNIASWNGGAERVLGYIAGEVVGRSHHVLFPAAEITAGRPAALLSAARQHGSVTQEFGCTRKDGSPFAAEVKVTALFDASGALRGYCQTTRDITERQRAQAALMASEARFRAMADIIPNLLFETDGAGLNVYVNRSLAEYSGLEQCDFADEGWLQFLHPDDRARVNDGWLFAVCHGTPYEIEYRCRRHDGAFRWFLCRSVPARDANGVITRWVGALTDIDDQKQAESVLAQHRDELERLVDARTSELAAREAELRENAALFRLITEHSNDMVSRVAADGTFLYASPASQRLLGLKPSQLTREVFLSRVHPDDLPALSAMRTRLFGGTVESELLIYRLFHVDGRVIWGESAAKSVRNEAGDPDGFISVLRDVTERRQLEETLRHKQKMEVIGHISSGVAHDFNNLLQTVIGGLELTLESMEAGAPGREFADMALGAATRGSYLTHHLLSYARKQMLQPRFLDLAPFLVDMQRLLSRTLGPHIGVRIDFAGDAPPVCVDPNQLQSALLNLAINAADAMPEGGVLTIGAGAAEAESGERLVALRVSDTGSGMDPATLAQACEPFFTTKGPDGTGLGLSMVQGFAEQSGGRLQIESQVGRGTTVVLLFRAAEGQAQPPPDLAALPQPSRRVLVVDDEPDVLVTAGAFLERAGLWVVRASSGNEALALLGGSLPFDAMVTDYAMPGLNGADLARDGQAMRPGLPVLIITGFAEVRELETLPANVQVLHKPFMRDDLLKALRRIMLVGDGSHLAPLAIQTGSF